MRHLCKNLPCLHAILILVLLPFLSACLRSETVFLAERANYKLAGVEESRALQSYLRGVVDERLEEEIPEDDERDPLDIEREEHYRERIIRSDLIKALAARGYYDAKVIYEDSGQALTGTYVIQKGDLYEISKITIEPEKFAGHKEALKVSAGMPLAAEAILESQGRLFNAIQKDECYFSLDVSHGVVLDRDNKSADLIFNVNAGPKAKFGPAVFAGNETVRNSYLQKHVTWKEDDCFRREKIESLRTKLLTSGLFSRADAVLPKAPGKDRRVPVTIELKERAHRTARAGASYYSDDGPGVTFGWEHRNFFGAAEKLEAEARISSLEQSLGLDLTKPFFLRKDQSLSLASSIRRRDTEAFEELAFGAGASVKRSLNKRLSVTTGVDFTVSRITEDSGDEDNFGLISLPNSIVFDNRDNSLDPHEGWVLRGRVEPFFDVLGASDPFFKTRANAQTYFTLDDAETTILALRFGVGSITGASTDNIPATERFYAGGGGSVRGFGVQEVGPFENEEPAGGRGLAEGAVELRYKFTDKFGAVAFVDAGTVSSESFPKFDDISIGVGAGVRYYTDFGPVRFDVATPVSGDDNVDQNYQFYISIGQAF